jgi:hypothetical protein
MIPTTQALSSTLADARNRAQREKREVICLFAEDDTAPSSRDQRGHGHPGVQGIRAIVRPDEPVLFCGLFPV